MHRLVAIACLLLTTGWVFAPGVVRAGDRVAFGLRSKAEADDGRYNQAVSSGNAARYVLDVTIQQGGPQVNHRQLLLPGRPGSNIASNARPAIRVVKQEIRNPPGSHAAC